MVATVCSGEDMSAQEEAALDETKAYKGTTDSE